VTQTRKRLLLGILTIIVVGGGWFYWFYFKSTAAAIRHAEAFLFRRMTVSQLDQQGQYRHYFITNRQLEPGDAPLDVRFTATRSDALSFGSFDVSIRPTLGLGRIIDATEWFQNEEIQLDETRRLEHVDFVAELRDLVDQSPKRSLLIVIHGFRERFLSALRKTAFIGSVLGINTPIVVFDWPGNQGASLRGYRTARNVAQASGTELAEALRIIVDEVQPDAVSLIANSMGGEAVVHAFAELNADAGFADAERELNHVILTAPDVDHREFDARFRNEIKALARDLTVYVSSNDRALLMSRWINREKRLGESTLSPEMLDEAVMISRLVEPGSDLISLVDVTPVNRTHNFHNFSLETPEYYDDVYLRLTSTERAPRSRLIYRFETPEQSQYWVLTRGR
jgi:esterase/lipase superfamily enzyme